MDDLYILDALFRPIDVVDKYVSLIWTDRWNEWGDFEFLTWASPANRKRFVHGTKLSIAESKNVMIVEKVEDTIDDEKGWVLKVSGRSIASVLEKRSALYISTFDSEARSIWYMSGWSRADTMRYMFWKICVDGALSANDIIPFIQWGTGGIDEWETLYPDDTIPEDETIKIWGQKVDSLYNAIKGLGDLYDLGFRMYKHPNESKLYFNVFAGSDRSSAQTDLPPVIFSEDMANLNSTTEFTDSSKEYNVVRVVYFYKDELDNEASLRVTAYDPNMDPTTAGFDKKEKLVVVNTIPEEVVDTLDYMQDLAEQELAKARPIGALDGEIDQYNQYQYERDYFLGDIVETRSRSGATAYMRVAEQIIVKDEQGKRSYPTLINKQFVNPGTWASWKYDVEWSAMGSEEYWANQE